jgi:hypothetical protein
MGVACQRIQRFKLALGVEPLPQVFAVADSSEFDGESPLGPRQQPKRGHIESIFGALLKDGKSGF